MVRGQMPDIMPSQESLDDIERSQPNAGEAEKWRLAQAAEMIKLVKKSGAK